MSENNRIELTDNIMSSMIKLSEGNPGAAIVVAQLASDNAKIDPDSAFGAISSLLSLDTLGIYGSHIWIFYKYLCKQNLVHMLAVMRACQLGFLSNSKLTNACQEGYPPHDIDVEDLYNQVKAELPNFNPDE